MSGFISISNTNNLSENTIHEITEFRAENNTERYISIFFKIKISKSNIDQAFLYIDDHKKEITNIFDYSKEKDEYSIQIKDTLYDTEYKLQIEIVTKNKFIKSKEVFVRTRKTPKIYGVRIDESNSNSGNSVSYIDNSIEINQATKNNLGGWSNIYPFNKISLVGLKSGKETLGVNPDNKKNYWGGTPVPQDVDVMVKIPKFYWNFTRINNGYEIRISEYKINNNYDCFLHKVSGKEKDFIYIGAYLGYVENGKLRSKSGVIPDSNNTISTYRQYAQANGPGYQQMNWFLLIALKILFIISYKHLDSQWRLGRGVSYNNSGKVKTGGLDYQGMIFGNNSSNTHQVCFLGIEDIWGNIQQFVDGAIYTENGHFKVISDNKSFNDNGDGYEDLGEIGTNSYGRLSKVWASNKMAFLGKEFSGSTTSYYADWAYTQKNSIARYGGHYGDGDSNGIFNLSLNNQKSYSDFRLGARLCYLGE